MSGMRLFTAIVLPRDLLEEIVRVVHPAENVAGEAAPGPRRLGLRSRRRATRIDGSITEDPTGGQLNRPSLEAMYLPISQFGNVTLPDSKTLADALRAEVATWRRPTVRFSGGTALEFPGDDSVWAKLDGDLDELRTIGRGVPLVVQRLGFFVDRRQFRPWLSVGTITAETTAPYLEAVVGRLEAHRSADWTIEHVSLLRRPMDAVTEDVYEEYERMPLA